MFPFKKTLTTKNITPWINSKKFIILHHTATGEGTINGVLNTLTKGSVSAHFVIDTNWDAYKIGDPNKDILWHAWISQWGDLSNLNNHSLWIEFIGPLKNGGFTREQLIIGTRLVEHLMAVFNIPKENVLRHKDIAPKRKIDIADSFFPNNDYVKWRDSLIPKAQ